MSPYFKYILLQITHPEKFSFFITLRPPFFVSDCKIYLQIMHLDTQNHSLTGKIVPVSYSFCQSGVLINILYVYAKAVIR